MNKIHRSPKFCFGAFLRKYPAASFPPIIKYVH